jgi:hypothetical protein
MILAGSFLGGFEGEKTGWFAFRSRRVCFQAPGSWQLHVTLTDVPED